MDQYIKQSIDSRKQAIFNTYDVNADGKKKIDSLFSEIEKLGNKCKDVTEFEAEFAKSPMNQKYLDLFTEIATTSTVKASVAPTPGKPKLGGIVAEGIVEGVADRALNQVERSVLPTRASVHQKAYDEARKVPGLGNAIDIGEKASYAAHLGRLFKKEK